MIGTTTVFMNDKHFGGDVVLETTVAAPTWVGVRMTVIPNEQAFDIWGGALVWNVELVRGKLETNEDVLKELKKDDYVLDGSSEIVDMIGAITKEVK